MKLNRQNLGVTLLHVFISFVIIFMAYNNETIVENMGETIRNIIVWSLIAVGIGASIFASKEINSKPAVTSTMISSILFFFAATYFTRPMIPSEGYLGGFLIRILYTLPAYILVSATNLFIFRNRPLWSLIFIVPNLLLFISLIQELLPVELTFQNVDDWLLLLYFVTEIAVTTTFAYLIIRLNIGKHGKKQITHKS